jgi:hypothetical protein
MNEAQRAILLIVLAVDENAVREREPRGFWKRSQ